MVLPLAKEILPIAPLPKSATRSHDLNALSHDLNALSHDLNTLSHDLNTQSHDLQIKSCNQSDYGLA